MPLRAHYRPISLVGYALGSAAFVVLGVWVLTKSQNQFQILVGYVAIIFFGWCGVVFLNRLRDRREILMIDRDGIIDHRMLTKPIPWTSVQAVKETSMNGQVYFLLTLSEPVDRFVESRFKRVLFTLNKPFGGDVFISSNGLTIGTDELRAALAEAWPPAG